MATGDSGRTPIIRVGVAGLGGAAVQGMSALAVDPRFKITAGADLRPEALDQFRRDYGGETYQSIEDMCASPNVDMVHVATPHNQHVEHVLAAVEHGKHVVVEKPMALTLEACDRMIEAAERNGVYLVVDRGSHGFDPPVRRIRQMVSSGDLGPLRMINSWQYHDSIYAARTPAELDDPPPTGGVFFRQGPHQIDAVRLIGGGMVRSIRAMTGVWDPERRAVGAFLAYLEFEDGVAASVAYTGYDHFDTDEFHDWRGTYGQRRDPDHHGRARRSLREAVKSPEQEAALKASRGYGGRGRPAPRGEPQERLTLHAHWGLIIASCDGGDLMPTPRGVSVYDDDGKREVEVPIGRHLSGYAMDDLYEALMHDRPLFRDGRWGKATLEVCLGIVESAQQHREVYLEHQSPTID